MAINPSKKITINGQTICYIDFTSNSHNWLEIVRPLFRASTFRIKENESYDHYLERLFYLLYYKKGYAADTNSESVHTTRRVRQIAAAEVSGNDILSALGIDLVKHNKVTSNIVFKNSGKKARIKNEFIEQLQNAIKKNAEFAKAASEISFGVELEFIGKESRSVVSQFVAKMKERCIQGKGHKLEYIGRYHHNAGKVWELGKDGSVHPDRNEAIQGFTGYELTSPILHLTEKDLNELRQVIDLVKFVFEGHTNKYCGTHVHMSFECGKASNKICKYFCEMYKKNEGCLFDKVVAKRRVNSRWCRCCNPEYGLWERYHKLNCLPASNNIHNGSSRLHLEFRQLQGTLDYGEIIAWVKLLKFFVEYTMFNYLHNINSEDTENLELTDMICQKDFNSNETEKLMEMGNIIRIAA